MTREALPLVLVAGVFEVVGFALFAFGARHGIAVSAVLSSQFAAIAAIAAYVLFRERLSPVQLAGVGVIVIGVATSAASRPELSIPVAPGHRDPELPGARHGVLAARGVELAIDALRVRLDGVRRDVQRVGDLPSRQRAGQQAQDRELAIGQVLGGPRGSTPAPARSHPERRSRPPRAPGPRVPVSGQRSSTPRASRIASRAPRGVARSWRIRASASMAAAISSRPAPRPASSTARRISVSASSSRPACFAARPRPGGRP